MKTLLSWSSGKDSAWSLHALRQNPEIDVIGLFTTLNAVADRVAMHAVRRQLLESQARAAGLPLTVLEIPSPCPNEIYEQVMGQFVIEATAQGVEAMAFGDLFLEDVRAYREAKLAGTGIRPLFPLWQRPTALLAKEMIDGGLVAHLTCVDPRQLASTFVGRRFDQDLLRDLPQGVDPCGEKGEFHTFVSAGPMFAEPIGLIPGPIVERDGFVFADFMPA